MKEQYVKAPGYINDLTYIFTLYFNRDAYIKSWLPFRPESASRADFDDVLSRFGAIDDRLYPFFAFNAANRSFFSASGLIAELFTECADSDKPVSKVFERVLDKNAMCTRLLLYAFHDLSEARAAQVLASLPDLIRLIDGFDGDERFKYRLLLFLLEPEPTLRCLYDQMLRVGALLDRYYADHDALLQKICAEIDLPDVLAQIERRKCAGHPDLSIKSVCQYSISLLNTLFYQTYLDEDAVLLIFGKDAGLLLQDGKDRVVDLCLLGEALREPKRVEILKLIREKGEIEMKDLHRAFSMSASTAYYHISLMIKAGMLVTRNRGRVICYRISEPYFRRVGALFSPADAAPDRADAAQPSTPHGDAPYCWK